MLAANATGTEKLKPIVIGSSIEPHALARLNYDTLPVTYRSNLKAWMRSDIFGEWLTELDRKFRLENRRILLLVDGATSHYNPNKDNDSNENNVPNEDNDSNENSEDMLESDKELNSEEESESESLDNEESYASSSRNPIRRGRGRPRLSVSNINKQSGRNSRSHGCGCGHGRDQASCGRKGRQGCARPYRLPEPTETPLTNIRIEFLPPHTTAHLQPMDAGIINSFKAKYKRKYIRHIIDQFEREEDFKT